VDMYLSEQIFLNFHGNIYFDERSSPCWAGSEKQEAPNAGQHMLAASRPWVVQGADELNLWAFCRA
jgi:hypothetical protein